MNKNDSTAKGTGGLPKAKIQKDRFSWLLWLVPAGALVICGWFVYQEFVAGGPLVTIYFQNAEGLEEKNTPVKYRGVKVGAVKSLTLTKDHQQIAVKAQLTGTAKDLARQGSLFWIARPELKVGAISGLRTIVSGEYIEVRPGSGQRTNTFVGVEKEPVAEKPGSLEIILRAPALGSMQELSPIFYRGIQVGEVLYFQISEDSREVIYHARIEEVYAPLVRVDTRFWNAGGINVRVGLFKGVQISAESAGTILSGGVEFATPTELQSPATNGAMFVLYDKAEDKWKTWEPAIKLKLPAHALQTNAPPELHIK